MTAAEQREAARKFINLWHGKGYEKGDTQRFWMSFMSDVLGVENVATKIVFEKEVLIDGQTKFIDAYIPETRVLIEQKSLGKDLNKKIPQAGGIMLTPYEQAKRYANNLPVDEMPRWIITCNFSEFQVHDMNKPGVPPIIIQLEDLQTHYYHFDFIVNRNNNNVTKEMEISIQAGDIVGVLYDEFIKQYKDPTNDHSLKSLNALCVRLVFCLYAEDAGIFGRRGMFHDYLMRFEVRDLRRALIDLFCVLDTKPEDRDPYLDAALAEFPYVNGGLFSDEKIEIPQFTEKIRDLILTKASQDFDWSEISPTIFGAVFESTLNPETRRSGGMHYTSIENIHKVIDPLFLDDLKEELETIKGIAVARTKKARLEAFQDKLASLRWMDPACGSGNFLTESYISIRRLENEMLKLKIEVEKGQIAGQITFGNLGEDVSPIKVSIGQFYGIEINDFAVTVAKTALWIAESQMMKETEDVVHMNLDFLPLKSYANIIEANALEIDWKDVISNDKLNYIMGNPPFVGGMYMSEKQKCEIRNIFSDVKGAGELDYVCAWYKLATEFMLGTKIRASFVSTNSICQGEQVLTFWKYMMKSYNIHIDFAYTTFVWNNEAKGQAKVHCVIIGFSGIHVTNVKKKLYGIDGEYKICNNISPYLADTPDYFIESRSTPLCNVPPMRFGSMPRDGGGFVLTPEERQEFIKAEPLSEKWIKPYIGAVEFLNNKERYCLWLVGAEPGEINKCPKVKKRVESVREFRAASKAAGTRKFALTPTTFCQIAQPDTNYIMVPKTSSGKRRYLPLGFKDKDTIASDLVFLIPDADLYEFGILMSNVHNAWMRVVAGRLKSDYRYSKDIVYNNFVWPNATAEQKAKITQTAQGILDARNLYPNSTLADMYNPTTMPKELQKAHQANDRAVMQAYGFSIRDTSEADCVAELMRLYQNKVENI